MSTVNSTVGRNMDSLASACMHGMKEIIFDVIKFSRIMYILLPLFKIFLTEESCA